MKTRQDILIYAKSLLNYTNYKLGAKYYTHNNNQKKPKYLDCSGFVVWCYKMSEFNVADGTYMQWQTSESVLEKELKIGDIGIMKENGTGTYNHVGIYAGDGYWIHCNYSRNGVTLEKTNIFRYPRRFKNIKFDDDTQKDSTDKSNTITSDTSKSEVDKEMVKMIQIESNGKVPTVNAINKDGNYYVKLRDLDKLGLLKVDYNQATKRPIVNKVN
ncbi:MAG: C40 family peptidase [Peptostreptococcaceae bacterium]|nr:C40 family peptidase [Peptostreptococcaceae bacterium]